MKIANVEMAAAWDGEEGDDWTENAARYEATDRWIAARFESECPIASADRVLDIGCGTGKSARAAARRATAGSVLGVHLSSKMPEYARAQTGAEGLTNVEYVRADAQVHEFDAADDLAISDFGAMFFNDPVAAFTNIGGALRSGGRIALSHGRPSSTTNGSARSSKPSTRDGHCRRRPLVRLDPSASPTRTRFARSCTAAVFLTSS